MMRPVRRLLPVLLIALAALVPAGAASADVDGPSIVGFVNAQRAANGIPAGIVEDPTLSSGCLAHDNYGRLNNVLIHDEDPAKPGYTPAGRTAAQTSVLYMGSTWTAGANPFETAPIHLHQLLAPRLDRMGAAESQGWGCATTLASRNRPAPPADITYTYPGDGAQDWASAQTASEGPYTPGEQVGIPAGTQTGPYLYVMFDGPDLAPWSTAQATGATLTGPAGAVPVVTVDNTTAGLTNYLPTGMEVIPSSPLQPNTTYTAAVSANVTPGGGNNVARAFTRTWSFTTGGPPNAIRITGTATASGGSLTVAVTSTAPGATVTASGPGSPAQAAVAGGGASLKLDRAGAWHVCAQSGGPGTGYRVAQDCVDVAAGADPAPVVIPPKPVAPKALVTFTKGAKALFHGRTLTVSGVRCAAACTLKVSATVRAGSRTTKLRALTVKRKGAGAATIKYTLSKTVARRLRAARSRRLALTLAPKGAATVRKTVAIGAK
jgi:hypothetical protein